MKLQAQLCFPTFVNFMKIVPGSTRQLNPYMLYRLNAKIVEIANDVMLGQRWAYSHFPAIKAAPNSHNVLTYFGLNQVVKPFALMEWTQRSLSITTLFEIDISSATFQYSSCLSCDSGCDRCELYGFCPPTNYSILACNLNARQHLLHLWWM